MKKEFRTALDIDDCIAAFTPHAHDFCGAEMGGCNYWSVEEMDSRLGKGWFESICKSSEFWKTIPVLNKVDFDFHCYMTSSPDHKYEERLEWLKINGFPDKPLVITNDKVLNCIKMEIDLLIDDKIDNILKVREAGLLGLHYVPHYASFEPVGDFITDLKDVNEYVRRKRFEI